ncbi:unnamed protein product [Amoebophrya sp. A120]|nr:unnamed protein product [Amoebophrya sp. A120]|eukprot:GSA120T00018398001.1
MTAAMGAPCPPGTSVQKKSKKEKKHKKTKKAEGSDDLAREDKTTVLHRRDTTEAADAEQGLKKEKKEHKKKKKQQSGAESMADEHHPGKDSFAGAVAASQSGTTTEEPRKDLGEKEKSTPRFDFVFECSDICDEPTAGNSVDTNKNGTRVEHKGLASPSSITSTCEKSLSIASPITQDKCDAPQIWSSFENAEFVSRVPFFVQKYLRRVFSKPSPIQSLTWPVLCGKAINTSNKPPADTKIDTNFIGIAPTGTGKTFAYLVPLLAQVTSLKRSGKHTQPPVALILLPTRELCCQNKKIYDEFHPRVRSAMVFGGNSKGKQVFALNRGCDLLMGTPGRLNDLLQEQSTTTSTTSSSDSRRPSSSSPVQKTTTSKKDTKNQDDSKDSDTIKTDGQKSAGEQKISENGKKKAKGTTEIKEQLTLRSDLLSSLQVVVVDEGDRMVDLGFEPQLRKIFARVHHPCSAWFFSASWSPTADKLARSFIRTLKTSTPEEVEGAPGSTVKKEGRVESVEVAGTRSVYFVQVGRESSLAPPQAAGEQVPASSPDAVDSGDLPATSTADTAQTTPPGDKLLTDAVSTPVASAMGESAINCRQEFCFFEADKKGFTNSDEKVAKLVEILQTYSQERVLVFCNMKKTVTWLHAKLLEHADKFPAAPKEEKIDTTGEAQPEEKPQPASAEATTSTAPAAPKLRPYMKRPWHVNLRMMHSDMGQEKRCATYLQFKTCKVRVLLATDVIGRGLNVLGLNVVVNFDAAENGEDHLHRIGRCGRDGSAGGGVVAGNIEDRCKAVAITFLGSKDVRQAKEILKWTSTGTTAVSANSTLSLAAGDRVGGDVFEKVRELANSKEISSNGSVACSAAQEKSQTSSAGFTPKGKGKGKKGKGKGKQGGETRDTASTHKRDREQQRAGVSAASFDTEKDDAAGEGGALDENEPAAKRAKLPERAAGGDQTKNEQEHVGDSWTTAGTEQGQQSSSAKRRARRKQNQLQRKNEEK